MAEVPKAVRLPRIREESIVIVGLGAIVVASWIVLFDPRSLDQHRLLGHRELAEIGAGSPRFALHLAAWTLMVVAMMLPTTVPLIAQFLRLVRLRGDRHRLLSALLAGYLATWLLYGAAVHLVDWTLHRALAGGTSPPGALPVLAISVLAAAAAYQLTPLKLQCLRRCRSPRTFLLEHWHGLHVGRDAVLLGIRHGLYCLGCCWALMLVMFAVGAASVLCMLALTGLMVFEKNLSRGSLVPRLAGAALALPAAWQLAALAATNLVREPVPWWAPG